VARRRRLDEAAALLNYRRDNHRPDLFDELREKGSFQDAIRQLGLMKAFETYAGVIDELK
jgi:hypothetical protein